MLSMTLIGTRIPGEYGTGSIRRIGWWHKSNAHRFVFDMGGKACRI
jgi:hypothetical protein